MQTPDSLKYGLRFAGVLDPGVSPIEKGGNPWRDEFGKFTDEAGAVFNVNAKLPTEELVARDTAYVKESKKLGRSAGFKNYIPKKEFTGKEPPRWLKLNRQIGKAEGIANTYMKRYALVGETKTPEAAKLKQYWLSNAGALRDIAGILQEKRDRVKVKKSVMSSGEEVILKEALPDFIAEAFQVIDEIDAVEGVAEDLDDDQSRRIKIMIVNNAVMAGLLPKEQAAVIIEQLDGPPQAAEAAAEASEAEAQE